MLAMQYSFVLPADYDMAIIRQRIAGKGYLLDNFPGLIFKAYLSADKSEPTIQTQDNLYAPFYVWADSQAMNHFLDSVVFAGLTQAFGWPVIRTWSIWSIIEAGVTGDINGGISGNISGDISNNKSDDKRDARYATRELVVIPPYTALAELRRRESELAQQAVSNHGALSAVSAFEPTSWTLVRFRLWRDVPSNLSSESVQQYQVGHISQRL